MEVVAVDEGDLGLARREHRLEPANEVQPREAAADDEYPLHERSVRQPRGTRSYATFLRPSQRASRRTSCAVARASSAVVPDSAYSARTRSVPPSRSARASNRA